MNGLGQETLRLGVPCHTQRASFLEMVSEFHALGEDWPHGAYGGDHAALDDFDAYVERVAAQARGENLVADQVSGSVFWLLADRGPAGIHVLGTLSFRHELNDYLAYEGGHMGYCIRPSARRRGYMTRFLKLALDEARARGLVRVLVTCTAGNAASAGVILKCGGVLEDERPSRRHPGELVQRYWIRL